MEIKLKSSMAKQASDKGFTLVEMMIVLFVISMLILIFPITKPQKIVQLQYEANAIKEILIQTQVMAMNNHQDKQVVVSSNAIRYLDKTYQLPGGISCTPKTIRYTDSGSIVQAGTIRCSCDGATKQIVYELGSGAVYVR